MAKYPMRTRLKAIRDGFSSELYFEPRQPEDLIALLAHSAATLFANVDRKRVRKCDHCVLHFQDTSKRERAAGAACNYVENRQKVAAYAVRQRLR